MDRVGADLEREKEACFGLYLLGSAMAALESILKQKKQH